MSLCDRCYRPGNCCRQITLSAPTFGSERTRDEIVKALADQVVAHAERDQEFPFEIVGKIVRPGVDLEPQWVLSCPKLQADGRCGAYDRRPDLCRSYQPTTDDLCVHAHGTEAGDPTVDRMPPKPWAFPGVIVDNEAPWVVKEEGGE